MSKIKPAIFLSLLVLVNPASAQSWKSVANKQAELQLLLLEKEMAELERKAAGPAPEEKKVESPSVAGPSIEPANPPIPLGPFGMEGEPMPLKPQTPMDEKIKLISIYGTNPNNLNADILYESEVITVSRSGERGLDSFYGWTVTHIDERQIKIAKTAKVEGKDKPFNRELVLRRAAMTPVIGSTSSAPAAPALLNDSTLRTSGGRFGIPRQGPQVGAPVVPAGQPSTPPNSVAPRAPSAPNQFPVPNGVR